MLPFALNHMTAPRLNWRAFLDLAAGLGCEGVEFRNDFKTPLFDGADPAEVGRQTRAHGLRLLALAEVKMFNDWSETKRAEVAALIRIARACGAEAISLIPRNDGVDTARADSLRATTVALREILPMLQEAGLRGMVEPLGFAACALRYKDVLAEAIHAAGGQGRFFMVHDTFHHALAGFGPIYPELTGIVHVSGVKAMAYLDDMRDPDRILVGPDDLLGNVAQLRALWAAGYRGPVSYEPFSPLVHDLADPTPALAASMTFIREGLAL